MARAHHRNPALPAVSSAIQLRSFSSAFSSPEAHVKLLRRNAYVCVNQVLQPRSRLGGVTRHVVDDVNDAAANNIPRASANTRPRLMDSVPRRLGALRFRWTLPERDPRLALCLRFAGLGLCTLFTCAGLLLADDSDLVHATGLCIAPGLIFWARCSLPVIVLRVRRGRRA